MINSNKILYTSALFIYLIVSTANVIAGELTEYDDLNFVTYRSGDNLQGFYRAKNGLFTCQFMFMSSEGFLDNDGNQIAMLPIKTFDFVPHKNRFSYAERDPRSDIAGELYLHGSAIILKTDSPHGGCLSAAGYFGAEPGSRGVTSYSATKRYSSVGIGIAIRQTYFYKKPGNRRQQDYIVAGDYVSLIRNARGYTYVRFVNPDMEIDDSDKRKVTTGWIHSQDLVDPFPPASKEPKQ